MVVKSPTDRVYDQFPALSTAIFSVSRLPSGRRMSIVEPKEPVPLSTISPAPTFVAVTAEVSSVELDGDATSRYTPAKTTAGAVIFNRKSIVCVLIGAF